MREASQILSPTGLKVVTLPIWLGEVETGTTYLENARLKANAAMRLVQRPVIAEDAGLEVDALGGLPGVRSARFAGPDARPADNNRRLLTLLGGAPVEARTARFRAIAILVLPSGAELVGEGVFEGRISSHAVGTGGFGYDPVFIPEGDTRTASELTDDEKNRISHRGRALQALAAAYEAIA